MRIKSSCRKGWIGPQLMWLHSREYMVCLAQCTQYLYGWVPYGRANVASYQRLIQIASCSFNEVAFQLGGMFPRDWKNKSGSHTCNEKRTYYTIKTCYRLDAIYITLTQAYVHLHCIVVSSDQSCGTSPPVNFRSVRVKRQFRHSCPGSKADSHFFLHFFVWSSTLVNFNWGSQCFHQQQRRVCAVDPSDWL